MYIQRRGQKGMFKSGGIWALYIGDDVMEWWGQLCKLQSVTVRRRWWLVSVLLLLMFVFVLFHIYTLLSRMLLLALALRGFRNCGFVPWMCQHVMWSPLVLILFLSLFLKILILISIYPRLCNYWTIIHFYLTQHYDTLWYVLI